MTEAPHTLAIRVYYEDTDFSGVVYHANYLRFFERGRTEALRALGIAQADLRDERTGSPMAFAVRHMEIDFQRSARMDDEVTVETCIEKLGGASVEMRQCIRRDDVVLVDATVRIALVADGRATRLPAPLAARLRGMASSRTDPAI